MWAVGVKTSRSSKHVTHEVKPWDISLFNECFAVDKRARDDTKQGLEGARWL